jgi:Protein O-mannosyl-transferase TMEM260-like
MLVLASGAVRLASWYCSAMRSAEQIPGDGPEVRLARWIGGAVFCVTAGLCVALAAPAGHWLDSAEFAAAAWELGNAHPPGHPLAILVGKAATLVPLGSIAFRVNCASGVALGVAAVLLLYTIRRVAHHAWRWLQPQADPPPAGILWPVSAAGALGFALGYAALFQGVRAEVYGLNLAINLGIVHLMMRYLTTPRTRDLVAAGLVTGLGLCNHHLLTLAVLPAGLAAVALVHKVPWRRRLAQVGFAAGAAVLGLAVLIHLPVRSARAPLINWGAPHTAQGFAWTVSAKLFSRAAERSLTRKPTHRAKALAISTAEGLSPGIVLAGLAGLILLTLRRRLHASAALVGLAILGNVGAAIVAGFEPDNPDSLGYGLLLFALLSALAAASIGVGLVYLHQRPAFRVTSAVLAAFLGIWPLLSVASAVGRADLRQAYDAEETAWFLLDAPPPGGLLLTSYYQSGFGVWAARLLSGARPDVDHVHRSYLSQPGYVANLIRRTPRLRPILGGLKHPGGLNYARLHRTTRQRVVLFEFDDDTYGEAMVKHSTPFGPLCRVNSDDGSSPARANAQDLLRTSRHQWHRLKSRQNTAAPDPLTRMYLLWAHYLRARYHVRRRDCRAARWSWDRARKLGNPRDPALLKIQRICRF